MQVTKDVRTRANARKRSRRISFASVCTLVAACVAIAACVFMLVNAFGRLKESIQSERKDYVEEISAQIISGQRFMKNEYTAEAVTFASMLSASKTDTLDAARALLRAKDPADILLVNDAGDLTDLNGKSLFLPDRTLLKSIHDSDEPTQLFSSLNSLDDFWLFTAPLTGVTIGGRRCTALVYAIPAAEYADSLAVALFDGQGATYLINADGSIRIEPRAATTAFGGYNLYASLLARGADEEAVSGIQRNVAAGITGSAVLLIDGLEWLVSHSPLDGKTAVVVTVPLTVTAAQTYRGLVNTILFASLLVMTVALLAILFILHFFRRDRERNRLAMAVAAKSDFFSKMSHDIRTPLNAVIGMEMLARENVNDPAVVAEYLGKSTVAANYLLSIINDVLDMSRIESGKMTIESEPLDMAALLDEVDTMVAAMADEKRVRFAMEADDFPTAYLGDAVRIKQVLMNLLSNATKFTPSGGRVDLRVGCQPGDAADVLTFTVSDDGVGMSEDYMTRIFSPFEQERSSKTRQGAGSGLGLAIVDNLVRLMGGAITVNSQLGVGSTFTVTLPLRHGIMKKNDKARQAPCVELLAGKRALVAEDNEVNQIVATRILTTRFAMRSDVAPDGRRAVEMFANSSPNAYDCILMDIQMPVMDGLEATRRIRALPRPDAQTVPIIALSANALEEDMASSVAVGMLGHLAKPIDVNALGAMLCEAICKKEENA